MQVYEGRKWENHLKQTDKWQDRSFMHFTQNILSHGEEIDNDKEEDLEKIPSLALKITD